MPYSQNVKVRNYSHASFFDFSASEVAKESIANSFNESIFRHKIKSSLQNLEKRVKTYIQENKLPISWEEICEEIKLILVQKLKKLQQFISPSVVKHLYEKINYYQLYQSDIMDPDDLCLFLNKRIVLILEEVAFLK